MRGKTIDFNTNILTIIAICWWENIGQDPINRSVFNFRKAKRGAFAVDALMAIFVVSLGAAAFMSFMPASDKAQRIAREDAVASQLCNRFLEQLRLLKPKDINFTTLSGLNLVDSYSQPGQSTYSFTNIPLDEASRYSPAQLLKGGTGTLTVVDLDNNAKELRVLMTWTSSSGKQRSIRSGTVLGGYR